MNQKEYENAIRVFEEGLEIDMDTDCILALIPLCMEQNLPEK